MQETWFALILEQGTNMGKKSAAIFSLVIILAFMGYMIYDASRGPVSVKSQEFISDQDYKAGWSIERTYSVPTGALTSVAVAQQDGKVIIGGGTYVSALNKNLTGLWSLETAKSISAVAVSGDTVFAASHDVIYLISPSGKMIGEWGPYESDCIITSVSASPRFVAFADAGNKRVFVLNKGGEVITMMGQGDERFVIPSPYFDVAVSGNLVFAANTGYRRIETWSIDGRKISEFGEAGTAPGAFCGCCNPAHFTLVPQGFLTAEKGINRIKISDPKGAFIEFLSVNNDFNQSVPLDVASADGETIYAANSFDNKLYVFRRK
jgi:WD40 repeat protein